MTAAVVNWNAGPGTIMTNTDPQLGGIIDCAIVSGQWFVIFNSDKIDAIEGLSSREAAIAAHDAAVRGTYWLA
jgi:hypothetical protein